MNNLTHGSLFSGIGGFDLAARWMGWENVFHCEREPFAQKVLAHHFPESKLYDDVTTFDGRRYAESIDVLSGGFPCQPFSTAGARKGKEDERYLWGEMLRVIREIKPRYVVGENVYGLVNWNSGEVFEDVCSSLEAQGYEVESYLLPASAIGAPHQRYRIFFVAYSEGCSNVRESRKDERESAKERIQERDEVREFNESTSSRRDIRNSDSESYSEERKIQTRYDESAGTSERIQRAATDCESIRSKQQRFAQLRQEQPYGQNCGAVPPGFEQFPTFPPVCSGDDGLPRNLDGITFSKWRNESIKAYGNAVVPPLIYEIFTAIQAFDDAQGR